MTDLKSVKSKYNGVYEYENKKFYLKKDEPLILIKKSTDQWWLCVRHNQNEPFFVPSTYLLESTASTDGGQRQSDVSAVDEIIDDLNERLSQEAVLNTKQTPPKVKERRFVNIDRYNNDDLARLATNTSAIQMNSLPSKQDDVNSVSVI
jgi:hypothetical protein